MPIERNNDRELVWYSSLAEVAGIEWAFPDGMEIPPTQAGARPVLEVYGDARLTDVTWVAADGSRLPGGGHSSPAEQAAEEMFDAETVEDVARTVSLSLALPGTKHDYFETVTRALDRFWNLKPDPLSSGTRFHLALLAIDLVESGMEEAANPPFLSLILDSEPDIRSVSMPYHTLLEMYQSEGFLSEATRTFDAIRGLPETARREDRLYGDPRELVEALNDLCDAVDWLE
ncbi:MAG: hypothetical protein KDB54_02395 [Solirubrobacterales bacterium]|nr:hypothetical protein [Solirubrobacterales bacterium]